MAPYGTLGSGFSIWYRGSHGAATVDSGGQSSGEPSADHVRRRTMRLFGFRVPFFVAVLSLGIGSTVWGLGYNRARVETVYLGPVTTTVTVPTSYAVTTSWVEPSSYFIPTSYATTYVTDPIAVVQPTYTSTAYIRTGLFGRQRLVERPMFSRYRSTYLPTAYFVPSSYTLERSYTPTILRDTAVFPSSYVLAADCVCPETKVASTAPSSSRSTESAAMTNRTRTPTKTIQSETADGPAMPSNVGPAPKDKAAGASSYAAPSEPIATNAQSGVTGAASPPPPPSVPRQLEQPKRATEPPAPVLSTPAATKSSAGTTGRQTLPAPSGASSSQSQPDSKTTKPSTLPEAPAAPDDTDLGPPDTGPPGEVRRQALRPALPSRPTGSGNRNILIGLVNSRLDGQPEEGVQVRVTNVNDQGLAKSTMTDAFGRFSMRLTDGDWNVLVTMPSGRVYRVSEIRVDAGQITDSAGRRVPSLEITR